MMKMQNLWLVTNGFPFGNSEQSFLLTEFGELVKQFHVTILAKETPDSFRHPCSDQIEVHRYHLNSHHASGLGMKFARLLHCATRPCVLLDIFRALRSKAQFTVKMERVKQIIAYYLDAMQIERQIVELSAGNKPDILYTYWCSQATVAAVNLKRKWKDLKVVTRFHGVDLYQERRQTQWQPLRYDLAKRVDKLIFACEAGKAYFLSNWGMQFKDKAVVAFLGCAPKQRISINPTQRLCMVSCSNMVPLKRIHYIIEALSQISPAIEVQWHHFGDGSIREQLESYAAERLSDVPHVQYKFWGRVSNEQLNAIYQEIGAQLFITTSETEGVPVSIQEAFAMGIPAIGTAVGGIGEVIISGKTGFLLPANPTIEQIVESIEGFYDMPLAQKQRMGETAYMEWAQKYDAQANAKAFAHMLHTLS